MGTQQPAANSSRRRYRRVEFLLAALPIRIQPPGAQCTVQTIEESAKSSLWLNHAGLRAILVVSIHLQNWDIPDIVNQWVTLVFSASFCTTCNLNHLCLRLLI